MRAGHSARPDWLAAVETGCRRCRSAAWGAVPAVAPAPHHRRPLALQPNSALPRALSRRQVVLADPGSVKMLQQRGSSRAVSGGQQARREGLPSSHLG